MELKILPLGKDYPIYLQKEQKAELDKAPKNTQQESDKIDVVDIGLPTSTMSVGRCRRRRQRGCGSAHKGDVSSWQGLTFQSGTNVHHVNYVIGDADETNTHEEGECCGYDDA